MSPRIPASWRICCGFPRAPDCAMTKSGLKGMLSLKLSNTACLTPSVVSFPEPHDLVVTFLISDKTTVKGGLDALELALRLRQKFLLRGRNRHVVNADGDARGGRELEARSP